MEFGLEILQLGFKRVDGLVNLLLVVPVHPGEGEDPDPDKSDDGQSVHKCSNIGQQVHGNSELKCVRFNFCFYVSKMRRKAPRHLIDGASFITLEMYF